MSEGPILHARARLDQALASLERRLAELDGRLADFLATPSPADKDLVARHEALKTEVSVVIAELDEMLGTAATHADPLESGSRNG